MTVMITGAAGFIGSNLVNFMLEKGFRVIGVDNFLNGFRSNIDKAQEHDAFSFYSGDVGCLGFEEILNKNSIDIIYHLAARGSVPASISDPDLTFHHNVACTHRLLSMASKANIKRVVMASSSSVYGNNEAGPKKEYLRPDPINPYGLSKLVGEQYSIMFNHVYRLNVAATRFFNVYGPGQRHDVKYPAVIPTFIHNMSSGKAVTVYGTGLNTRDFTFVEDVCEALYRFILISPDAWAGRVYNVARTSGTNINDLVILLKELLDIDEAIINRVSAREGDIRHSVGCNQKLARDLNYFPSTSLKLGLQKTIAWYKGGINAV